MSKMRVRAPLGWSVTRQRALVPPPHSSVKITLVPSLLKRRGVPVGEVRVGHRVQPHRVHRVRDVEQDAVALAGAGDQLARRERRDVVAGVGVRQRRVRGAATGAGRCRATRVLQAVEGAGGRVGEDPRLADDGGGLGGGQRDLDDVDAPLGRVAGGHRALGRELAFSQPASSAATARRPSRSCRCRCSPGRRGR